MKILVSILRSFILHAHRPLFHMILNLAGLELVLSEKVEMLEDAGQDASKNWRKYINPSRN